ncbi:MAG: trypsin-like peptidase domain-containing protein [Candidatus Moranbacteria bacterium]|nr:trypsin-like peptidase domain-containing protein [Candidatus Moranbacteria bacterium]
METNEFQEVAFSQEKKKYHCRHGKYFFLLFLACFFGFAGGLASPFVLHWYEKSFLSPVEKTEYTRSVVRERVVAEDQLVADLVEKNSPSVVSIVISRDVPKVRGFYNPFGSGFPFFFDPFNSGNQEEDRNDTRRVEKQRVGSGSGFFVSTDGLVVTNKHVVSNERDEYTVITSDNKEYPAAVLARDPYNDIAILKIDVSDVVPVSLGDSENVKVGQTVLAIGNPLGEFANSVSRGIVSGLQRSVEAGSDFGDTEKLSNIIQTDAAINPGNSGGPLFNLSGEVIGVNVAMASGAENIAFALPINSVKRVVEQVRTTGKISVPYIGVRYIILSEGIAKQNNLDVSYGALILRGQNMTDFAVIPGSPADKAGLMENDIILEINGVKIDGDHPIALLINQYNAGDEITLKVWHKGDTKDVKVRLEERR